MTKKSAFEMSFKEAQRAAIIHAKRNLYSLILHLEPGNMTADDFRIGQALILDSEIQALLSKLLRGNK